WGTYGTKCERKKVGTEYHFRLSPEEKQISVQELIEKLTPILKELEVQGRANTATMSPPTVRIMTAKIQKLLEAWAERPAADRDTATRSPSTRPSIGGPDGPFNGYSTACSAATSDNDARPACVAEAQSEADHQRSRRRPGRQTLGGQDLLEIPRRRLRFHARRGVYGHRRHDGRADDPRCGQEKRQ